MDNNFTKALQFTLKYEGGFSNDKADPGGKTKYGISDAGDGTVDGLIDLDRDGKGDVKAEDLTLAQAMEIYYKFYWLAAGCDKLELPMAVAVFDSAVNCGVGQVKHWLRLDHNYSMLITTRQIFYINLVTKKPAMNKYLKGWSARLVDLRKYCDILETELLQK